MPKPAATQPTRRIVEAPNSKPSTSKRTTPAAAPNQRPGHPIEGTATGRAAPSATALAPAPQLRFRHRRWGLAVEEPHLRPPGRGARPGIVRGNGDRERGPHGIEVEEEGDRNSEMRYEHAPTYRREVGGEGGGEHS